MAQVNTVIFEFSISLACWDLNWIQLNLSAKELQLNSVNFWLRKLQQDLRWIRLPENISHYPASVACLQRVCSYRCFSSFITIICLLISLGVWINGSFDILWLRTSIDEFKVLYKRIAGHSDSASPYIQNICQIRHFRVYTNVSWKDFSAPNKLA